MEQEKKEDYLIQIEGRLYKLPKFPLCECITLIRVNYRTDPDLLKKLDTDYNISARIQQEKN